MRGLLRHPLEAGSRQWGVLVRALAVLAIGMALASTLLD